MLVLKAYDKFSIDGFPSIKLLKEISEDPSQQLGFCLEITNTELNH